MGDDAGLGDAVGVLGEEGVDDFDAAVGGVVVDEDELDAVGHCLREERAGAALDVALHAVDGDDDGDFYRLAGGGGHGFCVGLWRDAKVLRSLSAMALKMNAAGMRMII